MLMDIRYAARWLAKHPMYSFVFILSLSIGMSLNTIIYSVYDAHFTRKLSGEVEKPNNLVWLLARDNNSYELRNGILYRDYLEYSENNTVFSDIAVTAPLQRRLLIRLEDIATEVIIQNVSGNYFTALGIKPIIGRGFNLNDEREEQDYALITYRLWKARFNGEPSVVGKTAYIEDIPYTITGVLPKGFDGVEAEPKIDVYAMLGKLMKNDVVTDGMGRFYYTEKAPLPALARLNKGVSLSQARAEMDVRARQLGIAYPDTNKDLDVYIAPVSEGNPLTPSPKTADKGILALIIVLVMVIPCVNVASLLLNRAVERSHEFALRSALGATRMRILRQLLTELLIFNILGGGLAILVFCWVVHIFSSVWMSQLTMVSLSIDWKVIGYAISFCIAISMLFGLLPILHVIRSDLASKLKSQGMAKGHGARMVLVCVELAISLAIMILVSPAITHRDNFQSELQERRILLADFDPTLLRYTDEKADQVKSEILSSIKSIPGVRNASFTPIIPYISRAISTLFNDDGSNTRINSTTVSPDYFDTLNIPIIRWRDILPYNYGSIIGEENIEEVIINKSMAEKLWPNEDVLGKQIRTVSPSSYQTIVGVVADSDIGGAGSAKNPMIFYPFSNHRMAVKFIVHFIDNEDEIKSLILRKIREVDPQLAAMANVRSLEQQYVDSHRMEKILLNILFWTGVVVFLVAATGIYSVISYAVNRRMREIGIRIMVGATSGDIVKLLIRGGVKIIVFGIAVGTFLAWVAATMTTNAIGIIPGIRPGIIDYICVSVILSIIMISACCLPIIKAIRSEPVNLIKE